MHNYFRPIKKSRLSLGGKKNHKTVHAAGPSHTDEAPKQPPTMERRWSVVGSGWNRKKSNAAANATATTTATTTTTISPVSVKMPHFFSSPFNVVVKQGFLNTPTTPAAVPTKTTTICDHDDDDDEDDGFMRISKSEYKAITKRVSAIESRISQEFSKVHADSLAAKPMDEDYMPISGPENVRNQYEKTLEECASASSSSPSSSAATDQLAKRLSRELKIRRSSAEHHRVIRSPSARKIGTMRRRSRENVRLSRNFSWHLGGSTSTTSTTTQDDLSANIAAKVNLKRGRPNTVQSGLRNRSPSRQKIHSAAEPVADADQKEQQFDLAPPPSEFSDTAATAEEWINAENFFAATTIASPMAIVTPMKNRPVPTPAINTPYFVSSLQMNEMKTPMLPPRVPLGRRTPLTARAPLFVTSASTTPSSRTASHPPSTPSSGVVVVNKLLLPLQQPDPPNGRASIARLRSQNAGMVAAKAKLFNGFVTDTSAAETPSSIDAFADAAQKSAVAKLKQRHRRTGSNSPRKSTTPRRGKHNGGNKGSVQRRQRLRLSKSPGSHMHRNPPSPLHLQIAQEMLQFDSPTVERHLNKQQFREAVEATTTPSSKTANCEFATPQIKRPLLLINSPRHLMSNKSRGGGKRSSPMRATSIKLRSSPRLQLQSNIGTLAASVNTTTTTTTATAVHTPY